MSIDLLLQAQQAAVSPRSHQKVMLVTPTRMFYAGVLGQPTTREFGAITIYVSFSQPFEIALGNELPVSAHIQVVQPGVQHHISTSESMIGMWMIEPESVDLAKLPLFMRPDNGAADYPQALERLRAGLLALTAGRLQLADIRADFDRFFFGEDLPARALDPRIAAAVRRVQAQLGESLTAEDLARDSHLSVSRFLHLFKDEVGSSFRHFRAWKRVRSFLGYVNTQRNLTDIAMETGYPSSSHFSYAVRHYWGLAPRDMVASSRQLAVIHDGYH